MAIQPAIGETVLVETDRDGITTVTFHRPDARNALNLAMVKEAESVLESLRESTESKIVIFRGAGDKAFISGADIAELKNRGREEAKKRINSNLFRMVETLPQVTIAAITGYALGGGLELALACDLRIAGQSSKMGLPEVSLGIMPAAGGCTRLPRIVGVGRAKELIFSARILGSEEALRIGLVQDVKPDNEVYGWCVEQARLILRNSVAAVQSSKKMIDAAHSNFTEEMISLESELQSVLFESDEKHRRMAAFLEKRNQKR